MSRESKYIMPSKKILEQLSEFFDIDITGIRRHIRNGIPMVELYNVLTNKKIPRGVKKRYLYGLKLQKSLIEIEQAGLSEEEKVLAIQKHDKRSKQLYNLKDNVWTRFIGDKGFDYSNKSPFMKQFRKYQEELRKEGFNL